MSGHNKWSKIKHKKAATDAEKSKIFSRHAKTITAEVRTARGDTQGANVQAAVERAKKDSMPKENIERALERGRGGGTGYHEVIFEGFNTGGVGMLIVTETDNNNRTAPEIKHIFTKHGATLGVPGSAAWAFSKIDDGYVPTAPIEPTAAEAEKLTALVDALLEHDDVVAVYTTADTAAKPDE